MKLIRTCMGLAWMAFAYVFVANALLCTSLQWNLNKLMPIRGGSLGFIDALTRGTSSNWNVLNLYMNIYLLTDDWQEPSIMSHLICNGRIGTTIAELITKLEILLLIIIVGYFVWWIAHREASPNATAFPNPRSASNGVVRILNAFCDSRKSLG